MVPLCEHRLPFRGMTEVPILRASLINDRVAGRLASDELDARVRRRGPSTPMEMDVMQYMFRTMTAALLLLSACGGDDDDELSGFSSTGDAPASTSAGTQQSEGSSEGLDTASSGGPSIGGPPEILGIVAMPAMISEGDIWSISVQATDPDGLDDIVGATLLSSDGGSAYGVLEQISGGTFSTSLSWSQIHAVVPIEFIGTEERVFLVEILDAAGGIASEMVSVTLSCDEGGACDGDCTPLDTDSNCGMCGVACELGADCVDGLCEGGFCGDGWIDPGENCDGTELGGFDCFSLGFMGGELACNRATCMFDVSMCF